MSACDFYRDAKGRSYFLPLSMIESYKRDNRRHNIPQGVKKYYTQDGRIIYFAHPFQYPPYINKLRSIFSRITFDDFKKALCNHAHNNRVFILPKELYTYLLPFLDKSALACLYLTCYFFRSLIYNPALKTLSLTTLKENHFELFLWARKFNPPKNLKEPSYIAAQTNNLPLLITLHALNYPLNRNILFLALPYFEIVKWLSDHCRLESSCIFEYAALTGNEEMFKWAKDKYRISGFNLAFNAAKNGKIEMLKDIANAGLLRSSCPYAGALEGDQLHVLAWLKSIHHQPPRFFLQTAQQKPHFIEWINQNWQLASF